jgi:uncharacterized membrane protein (Fun14 family)
MDPLGVVTLGVGGFALGTVMGLALRALSKVFMYAVGLYLVSLAILSSFGIIIVNWSGIESALTRIFSWIISLTQTDIFSSMGLLGISSFIGVLYGLTRGTVIDTVRIGEEEFEFFRRVK